MSKKKSEKKYKKKYTDTKNMEFLIWSDEIVSINCEMEISTFFFQFM